MDQSAILPASVSGVPDRSMASAPTPIVLLSSNALAVSDTPSPMQQLRSVVAELFAALACALNDERDSAEDSLSRAAAILQEVACAPPLQRQEQKGRLAPWQVRRVSAYVEAKLDMPIRSSELAAVARLSPCHFSRVFRNSFGCSPLEYVTRRRMEHAQGLMLSTDAPLSQIALDCGLADQAHFSRLFRRCVGETPRAWRRARVAPLATHSEWQE